MRSAVVAFAILALPMSASAANPRPFTIPALREWKGGHGAFVLPKKPRVGAPRQLSGVAHTLAGELRGAVVRKGGDIRLALAPTGHGGEAYRLAIGGTVRITAGSSTGVFWG